MTTRPPRRGTRRRRISNRLWGGSRFLTNRVIEYVNSQTSKAPVTSRKRWELFGNPGSDHYRGNRSADAVDFGIANATWLRDAISHRFGGPKTLPDFGTFIAKDQKGRSYRVQVISGTHGTGPHLHVGVKRL